MSTQRRPPIGGLADQVVRSDVAAQQSVGVWEKGTWTPTTAIATGTGGDWLKKALAVLAGIAILAVGIFTGYTLLNNQPAASPRPSLIAAPPTASPTTVTGSPVLSTPTPTLVTGSVVPSTPTPAPTQTVVPITPPPILLADGLEQIVTGDPVGFDDLDDDQGPEAEDDPEVDHEPGTELADGYIAPASIDGAQGLALIDGLVIGGVRTAQVDELWPCTDANVFCGPGTLAPGDYYVIGFNTAGPPSEAGTDQIYQSYYILTDLDGDFTNNGFVTPPRTNNIYLSTQYVIEGGWYGTVKGLGETDYRGPIGPDGQTARYNQQPAARMVLTQDPPGGFFIVPQDRIGNWFRIATIWRDVDTRAIAVDAVGVLGGLELLPVPGRAELPQTLSCARVDVVAEPLGAFPSQLMGVFQVVPRTTLDPSAVLTLTLLSGALPDATLVDYANLALEDLGDGAFAFRAGVPEGTQQGFASLEVGPPEGDQLDLTEEFIVLSGAGVNIPPGFTGHALGNPDCGS
jgi:hypothetical protein